MPQTSDKLQFPAHFDGKRFRNPEGRQARGLLDVLRWKLKDRPHPSPAFVSDVEPSQPPAEVKGSELLLTYVNHSTVLLQQDGSNILTDPIWSQRASPFSSIGPRRRRIPGVRKEDLPHINVVLISHNHYDHLDLPTLRWLAARSDKTAFIVPLGIAKLLRPKSIASVHELDWGDTWTFGRTAIYSVPALHFSARGPFDRNKTLWCGYVIVAHNRTVYFAADTGFGSHFAQIREAFGPPALSLLPIGAYEPRWFMSPIHMSPEEALKAHEILGSKASIGIHQGTFQLADDGLDEATDRLAAIGRPDSFHILKNGQSLVMS